MTEEFIPENLTSARHIFKEEVQTWKPEKGKDFWIDYFYDEKIIHSEDVSKAAEWLLKNALSPVTQKQKDELLFASLLHDIGRFEEINRLSKDRKDKTDHGVCTAKLLRQRGLKDEALILALEHHGHSEPLYYNDERVQSLSDTQKKRSKKIFEFVRDVDRIGNFHRWTLTKDTLEKIDGEVSVHTKSVNKEVIDDIFHSRPVDYKKLRSFEDRIAAITSWVFALYLKESFMYINHFKTMRGMFYLLEKHVDDKSTVALIEERVNEHIQKQLVK